MVVKGAIQVAHQSLLYYHSLCSFLEDVERDFFPSFDFDPDHQIIHGNKNQPELRCSGLDHHH